MLLARTMTQTGAFLLTSRDCICALLYTGTCLHHVLSNVSDLCAIGWFLLTGKQLKGLALACYQHYMISIKTICYMISFAVVNDAYFLGHGTGERMLCCGMNSINRFLLLEVMNPPWPPTPPRHIHNRDQPHPAENGLSRSG